MTPSTLPTSGIAVLHSVAITPRYHSGIALTAHRRYDHQPADTQVHQCVCVCVCCVCLQFTFKPAVVHLASSCAPRNRNGKADKLADKQASTYYINMLHVCARGSTHSVTGCATCTKHGPHRPRSPPLNLHITHSAVLAQGGHPQSRRSTGAGKGQASSSSTALSACLRKATWHTCRAAAGLRW